jgi:hypothetical protein
MSDELQRQLAEFLKFLLAQAQDATTWAKAQLPPLVDEKIRFGRVWHSLVVVICLLVAWRAFVFVKFSYRKLAGAPEWVFGIAFGSALTAFMGAIAMHQLHDAALAWAAPRLYVVEWLLSLTTAK